MNHPEESQTTGIDPVDIERRVKIWKWLLYPRNCSLPNNVTKEEVVEVFHRQTDALDRFRETSERVAELQGQIKNS